MDLIFALLSNKVWRKRTVHVKEFEKDRAIRAGVKTV